MVFNRLFRSGVIFYQVESQVGHLNWLRRRITRNLGKKNATGRYQWTWYFDRSNFACVILRHIKNTGVRIYVVKIQTCLDGTNFSDRRGILADNLKVKVLPGQRYLIFYLVRNWRRIWMVKNRHLVVWTAEPLYLYILPIFPNKVQ